jgi:hypothetical protein
MKSLFVLVLLVWILDSAMGQITVIKDEQHLAILKRDQKIFLDRGDYMKDKILRVTDKDDTVIVLEADRTFFKFRKDTLVAWSLTAQVDQGTGIITKPKRYEIKMPFKHLMRSDIYAYDEASKIANKILDLKKGELILITNRNNNFFEIMYKEKTAFIFENDILPIQTQHPIRKAQSEDANVSGGRTYYKGAKGGCYYLTSSGEKIYVDRSLCH